MEWLQNTLGAGLGILFALFFGFLLVLLARLLGAILMALADGVRLLPAALARYAARDEIVTYYYRDDTRERVFEISEPTPDRVKLARAGKAKAHSMRALRKQFDLEQRRHRRPA